MAKKNRSIKQIIKKKIRVVNNENVIIDDTKKEGKTNKVVLVQDRITPTKSLSTKTVKISNPVNFKSLNKVDRFNARSGKLDVKPNSVFKDYGKYVKKEKVDYDCVITISSYNRYEKVDRILDQLFSQQTKYKFKIMLMNDGSDDERYEMLQYKYPDIIYLVNTVSLGKIGYWKTINKIWNEVRKINAHNVVQLDDDFILCNHFINRLLDIFFEEKEKNNNYMAFSFHLYNFEKDKPLEPWWYNENEVFVDGGVLFDIQFMEKMNYELNNIEHRVGIKTSSFTWVRVKEYLEEFGMRVFRTKNSLVWHDGNDDSKHHPTIRAYKRVYTKYFIDEVDYEQ